MSHQKKEPAPRRLACKRLYRIAAKSALLQPGSSVPFGPRSLKVAALALAILAGFVCSSSASLILSDNFSYADGNLTNVSGGTWYAHGNIGGTPLLVNNGQIRIVGGNLFEDDSANLAGGPYATNSGIVLYSSYTLIISNAADLPSPSGNYVSHFKDAFTGTNGFGSTSNTPGFSFHGLVWLSTTNVAY